MTNSEPIQVHSDSSPWRRLFGGEIWPGRLNVQNNAEVRRRYQTMDMLLAARLSKWLWKMRSQLADAPPDISAREVHVSSE